MPSRSMKGSRRCRPGSPCFGEWRLLRSSSSDRTTGGHGPPRLWCRRRPRGGGSGWRSAPPGRSIPTVRPAARDGLVAWAAASGAAFAVKSVAGRRRPRVPGVSGSSPSSSSMPSSHTAGAAAYAVAATLRLPTLGVVVVPAAVAVGWSRAATGRHFPTDVAVGAIVGAAVGGVVHTMARRFERAGVGGPGRAAAVRRRMSDGRPSSHRTGRRPPVGPCRAARRLPARRCRLRPGAPIVARRRSERRSGRSPWRSRGVGLRRGMRPGAGGRRGGCRPGGGSRCPMPPR